MNTIAEQVEAFLSNAITKEEMSNDPSLFFFHFHDGSTLGFQIKPGTIDGTTLQPFVEQKIKETTE